ncbi:spore germination protein [Gorillibacterium sp. sgz5001074]|uniref:spore germination protein n=1 Tax=Gorillibacterium sp. sgz5001074 TaxID=3446695 RepID=UPI003F6702CB
MEAVQAIESVKRMLGDSADFVSLTLQHGQEEAAFLYIKTLVDEKTLEAKFITPYVQAGSFSQYERETLCLSGVEQIEPGPDIASAMLQGKALCAAGGRLYLLDVLQVRNDRVSEATVEATVQGPKFALSEALSVNLNLIRSRYPQPSLKVEMLTVGKVSKTMAAMIYDQDTVDPKLLDQVKTALARIRTDMVQSVGELHRELTGVRFELFPTLMITERPDRIAHNLMHGKVVFVLNGTPFVLILPTVFYDFMAAMDDIYQHYWPSRVIVVLRYAGLIISLMLSAVYVAITSFNPEILRVQLALSIAGSRAPVPYPSYIEVMFMLLMMEMLMEASIRLPKAIGSTATTVGGLILGQAATQAGLISNIMIIIVASVAISNFVVPVNAMTVGIRFTKYLFLIMATFFGIVGILLVLVMLVAYLTNKEVFGQPYLKLFMEAKSDSRKQRS